MSPTPRVVQGVLIRAEPLAGSDVIGTLRPGETAPFVSYAPGWRGVRLPEGRAGYVSKT